MDYDDANGFSFKFVSGTFSSTGRSSDYIVVIEDLIGTGGEMLPGESIAC